MNNRYSTGKKDSIFQATKRDIPLDSVVNQSGPDNHNTDSGEQMTRRELTCKPIRESERKKIISRMSPESIIISEGTKWSEKGFIPSFEDTDKVLMKAARRTHKALVTDNQ